MCLLALDLVASCLFTSLCLVWPFTHLCHPFWKRLEHLQQLVAFAPATPSENFGVPVFQVRDAEAALQDQQVAGQGASRFEDYINWYEGTLDPNCCVHWIGLQQSELCNKF